MSGNGWRDRRGDCMPGLVRVPVVEEEEEVEEEDEVDREDC